MAQSDKKTVVNYNWLEFLILLVFIGGTVFFGIKTARLTEKDTKHIQKQAVLEYQKDSLVASNRHLEQRIIILESDVQLANKNSSDASKTALAYKKRYVELKASKIPDACDSSEILKACEKSLLVNENLVLIMRANVLSYAKLSDTLRLSNTYLTQALDICNVLTEDQKKEVGDLRKKVRRRGLMNMSLGGVLIGAIIILAVK